MSSFHLRGDFLEVVNLITLFVTYKCSLCKKTVTVEHIVQERISVSTRDAVIWQNTANNIPSLNEKSKIQYSKKLTKIYNEQKKGLYRLAEFNCKCPHCSHREPWSKTRYRIPDTIFGAVLPFGILLTLIAFPIGISILGLVIAYLLTKQVHRAIIEKRIHQLPQQSLPHFALTKEKAMNSFYQNTSISSPHKQESQQ